MPTASSSVKVEKNRIIRAYIRAGTWRGAAKLLDVSEKTLIQLRKKHRINLSGVTVSAEGNRLRRCFCWVMPEELRGQRLTLRPRESWSQSWGLRALLP